MARKILFIQHAGGLGGSAYSLLYTLQGLRDAGDECVVLLARPTAELAGLYSDAGFAVIANEPFSLIDHSTVAVRPLWRPSTYKELYKAWAGSSGLPARLATLIASTRCDLVHLNSMPLVPLAHALNEIGFPYAWHVREPPPDQGVRTRLIRQVMRRCSGMIFLSRYDRKMWMGMDQGTVVNNFVPDRFFHPAVDRASARAALGVTGDAATVLFLGGAHPAKGSDVVLNAMYSERLRHGGIHWLIPNALAPPSQRIVSQIARHVMALVGTGPRSVRFYNSLKKVHHVPITLTGFQTDVLPCFVAADIVLFPATAPHFARPLIEAAAVGRATVGSRIGGVDELIVDGSTGILVPPGDVTAIANAIHDLAHSPSRRDQMGAAGKALARERFDLHKQITLIRAVHNEIASDPHAARQDPH